MNTITEKDIAQIREEERAKIMEKEIEPLKAKLEAMIQSGSIPMVQVSAPPAFKLPTPEQVMEWIAPGCKDPVEVGLFLETCKHLGLDPIKREIYLVPYYDSEKKGYRWSPIIDYKVGLARAQRDPDYMYFEASVWRNTEGEIEKAKCRIYKHSFLKTPGHKGYFEVEVDYKEYEKTRQDGSPIGRWRTAPKEQIEKCAISKAHRLLYAGLMQGLPPMDVEVGYEEGETEESRTAREINEKKFAETKKIDAGFFVDESLSKSPAEIEKAKQRNGDKVSQNEVADLITLLHDAKIEQKKALDYCKEIFKKSSFGILTKSEYMKLLECIKEESKE